MQTHAHAIDADPISRLQETLRVTTDSHDRLAIKAIIEELELRRIEARDAAR